MLDREHLDRLRRSAAGVYMDLPLTDAELEDQVRRAAAAVGSPEAYVRIIVSRGVGEIELHPGSCERRTLVLIARPFTPPPDRLYREGVRLAVVPRRRNSKDALSPAAKTGNYLNNVLAMVEAGRRGADDAVMLNAEGNLTEATTANVFLVPGGTVRTQSLECGILEGIPRAWVIRLLAEQGVPVEEGRYGADDLRTADEAFLTSTTRDVMPVASVDDAPLPGSPGPVTRRLKSRGFVAP